MSDIVDELRTTERSRHFDPFTRGLCGQAADEIERLREERDKYHDALIARHGGEPVALLHELDEARDRIAKLEGVVGAVGNLRTAYHAPQGGDEDELEEWRDEIIGACLSVLHYYDKLRALDGGDDADPK